MRKIAPIIAVLLPAIAFASGSIINPQQGGGGGGGGGSGWSTVLHCNLVAEAPQTFSADGTYTICNKTATVFNAAASSPAAAISPDGGGLEIYPTASTNVYVTGFSAPAVCWQLSTLIPGFNQLTELRALAHNSKNNAAAQFDQALLVLYTRTPNTDYSVVATDRGVQSGTPGTNFFASFGGGGNGFTSHAGAYSPTAGGFDGGIQNWFDLTDLELDVPSGYGVFLFEGFGRVHDGGYGAVGPTPWAIGEESAIQGGVVDTTRQYTPELWYLCLSAYRNGSATSNFTAAFDEIQIDAKLNP